jgi:hypothetical protein
LIVARGISGYAQRPPIVRPFLLFSLFFPQNYPAPVAAGPLVPTCFFARNIFHH